MALSKLWLVERLAGSSFGIAEQARRRCFRQPDNAVRDVPSKGASVFEADVNNRVSAGFGSISPWAERDGQLPPVQASVNAECS
jgi:hypothetical protein